VFPGGPRELLPDIGMRCNAILDLLPEGEAIACYAMSRWRRLPVDGESTRDGLIKLFEKDGRGAAGRMYRECATCAHLAQGGAAEAAVPGAFIVCDQSRGKCQAGNEMTRWRNSWDKACSVLPNVTHGLPVPVWAGRGFTDSGPAAWSRLASWCPIDAAPFQSMCTFRSAYHVVLSVTVIRRCCRAASRSR